MNRENHVNNVDVTVVFACTIRDPLISLVPTVYSFGSFRSVILTLGFRVKHEHTGSPYRILLEFCIIITYEIYSSVLKPAICGLGACP